MGLTVVQPSGSDVTVANAAEYIYLRGNADTDGSLRLLPTTNVANQFKFQLRTDGTWNDTGIQVQGETVHLGRNLSLASAGEWLETNSQAGDTDRNLVPHINFNDDGTQTPHVPLLSPKVTRLEVQPDDSSEVSGLILESLQASPVSNLVDRLYLKVGSIGATESVLMTFRYGGDAGPIFWEHLFPASLMATPGAEIHVEGGLNPGFAGGLVHIRLSSVAPISLKSNLAGDFWTALDFWLVRTDDLIQENLVIADDAGIVLTEDASFLMTNAF